MAAGIRPLRSDYPRHGDTAYCSWRDAGLGGPCRRRSRPKLVTHKWWAPPYGGDTHNALALADRELLVVMDEAVLDHQEDGDKPIWIFDIRERSNPIGISTFPAPSDADYKTHGHFGPHNIHENRPGSFVGSELIFATYQNAGLRVFDIRNKYAPVEVAALVPPPPAKMMSGDPKREPVIQMCDIFVTKEGRVSRPITMPGYASWNTRAEALSAGIPRRSSFDANAADERKETLMPRFCANLKWLFTELPFLDRFDAAAKAGFVAVEYASPYEFPAAELRARLASCGLRQVLINTPTGDSTQGGGSGFACLPGRREEFRDWRQEGARLCGGPRLPARPCDGWIQPRARAMKPAAVYAANLAWAAEQTHHRMCGWSSRRSTSGTFPISSCAARSRRRTGRGDRPRPAGIAVRHLPLPGGPGGRDQAHGKR